MQLEEFQKYLRAKGKQAQLADELVKMVASVEARSGKNLNEIKTGELVCLLTELEHQKEGSGKKAARAVGLYLKMTGQSDAAAAAQAFREEVIAGQRSPLLLKKILNIAPEALERLRRMGIVNAQQILAHGRTKTQRETLSHQSGLPYTAVLELVKLSDLSRIFGVKGFRARLYYAAGVDYPAKLSRWDPQELCTMLVKFITRTEFPGIAPLLKEARFTVEEAKTLPEVIEYED